MTTAKPLPRKQVKEIFQVLKDMFGIELKGEFLLYKNNKDKIFLLKESEHLAEVNFEYLRIDRMGLYIAEYKNGFLRPSMQGLQFLVDQAKKQNISLQNTLELTKEQVEQVFKGEELQLAEDFNAQALILMYQGHVIGFAQAKDGKLLNYIPKTFRGTTIL